MRKCIFLMTILLLSCGGDGGDGDSAVQHVPEITAVVLSPNQAGALEGDGSVTVTAQVGYFDSGLDIQTLYVRTPDGTILEFDQATTLEQGSLAEQFTMSTETAGSFELKFWLVDTAGDSSEYFTATFEVSGWASRLSGLPKPLLDVTWDGTVFIAVGYDGAILTSVDGIDWVAQESVSDDVLVAVTAFGADTYAVGGAGVLLSTDHGETWTVVARPEGFIGTAVAASSSHVVVLGTVPDLGGSRITISDDGGETWQTSTLSWGFWGSGDLIYRDGLFVTPSGPGVRVSPDGKQWNEIVVSEAGDYATLREAIVHDDDQFFVVDGSGTVFSSFDAFNWTELSTPLVDVWFAGAAWNGTRLIFAGGVDYFQSGQDADDTFRPIGISSSDGGESWDVFGIDAGYESSGVAWGNGRFVSVGRSVVSDEGAIYTTE